MRRKKEKSVEKDSSTGLLRVGKKLSVDNSSEAEVIEEEGEEEEEREEVKEKVVVERRGKGSPSSLARSGLAAFIISTFETFNRKPLFHYQLIP